MNRRVDQYREREPDAELLHVERGETGEIANTAIITAAALVTAYSALH
jgi:hypothetical protein